MPGDTLTVVRLGGVDVALTDLRGPVAGRRPVRRRRGGPGSGWSSTSTARRTSWTRTTCGCRWCARRAAEAGATVAYVNMVGGQDELVFDGDSMVVTADGELLARAPQFAEELLVTTSTCRPAAADAAACRARRRRDADRRARHRAGRRRSAPLTGPAAAAAGRRRAGRRRGRGVAGAGAGPARLRRARTASARWCSACPAASTRRWWPRSPSTRSARTRWSASRCPASYSSEHSRDDAADLAKRTGLRLPGRADPADGRRVPGQPVAVRPGGGEPAGPGARRDPDGAVQPGGPPGADHRQQERAGGRLLHPLRRLGRRLQPAQGRAEDAGVEAGPVAQRGRRPPRRDAADPGELDHQAAERRAAPRPARHRLAARLRRCSTRSWPATSTATWAATTWSRPATTRRWWTGCCGWSTWPSTSAASPRPARRSPSRRSAATAACRSPTAGANTARRPLIGSQPLSDQPVARQMVGFGSRRMASTSRRTASGSVTRRRSGSSSLADACAAARLAVEPVRESGTVERTCLESTSARTRSRPVTSWPQISNPLRHRPPAGRAAPQLGRPASRVPASATAVSRRREPGHRVDDRPAPVGRWQRWPRLEQADSSGTTEPSAHAAAGGRARSGRSAIRAIGPARRSAPCVHRLVAAGRTAHRQPRSLATSAALAG